MVALARRLQEIKDNTDVCELQKHREEIEQKSRAIKASTQEISQQHRDLESSLALFTSQIEEKNRVLTSLQQKTNFLNKSAAAFQNVLKQQTGTKSRRRDDDDRMRELARKDALIIDLTVRLEMLKRESAEKDEEEKRMKLKLVELQHQYEIETGLEDDPLASEELNSIKGSAADSLTYDGSERRSVKSMSIMSQSEQRDHLPFKHMSMYEGQKQPMRFAKPNLMSLNQPSGQPLDESNMSEFELELYNCAKAAKPVPTKTDLSDESTTMLGKRTALKSVLTNDSKKRGYVRHFLYRTTYVLKSGHRLARMR